MPKMQKFIKLKDISKNNQFLSTCYSEDLETTVIKLTKQNQIPILEESSPLLNSQNYSPISTYFAFMHQGFPIEINQSTTYLITCNPFNKKLRPQYNDWHVLIVSPSTYIYFLSYQYQKNTVEGLSNLIHFYAFRNRITDIHIFPVNQWVYVQFHNKIKEKFQFFISKRFGIKLLNYLKLTSYIDPSITRKPQDGAYTFSFSQLSLDIRLSTLPTFEGEMLSLRLFTKIKTIKTLDKLGFSKKKIELIHDILTFNNGLILITGTTGSGKSTTLYTILTILSKQNRHIITLEDPIEQHIPNIHQTSVNPAQGYTLQTGLKATLRHNPDVIAIGEIRDSQTAETVINAAYSGHLVIASLHTNSIESTLLRLSNLGCNPFLISYCLRGIISQKLCLSKKKKLYLDSSILYCKSPYIIQTVETQLTTFIKHNILLS